MRLGEGRRQAQRGLELLGCAAGIAAHEQRRAQLVVQRRLVRRQLDALAKRGRGGLPVALVQRLRTAHFVSNGAFQRAVELQHQRIGRTKLAGPAPPHVRFRSVFVARAAIGQRQRIVDHHRLWRERERLLQMLYCACVVRSRQRRAP